MLTTEQEVVVVAALRASVDPVVVAALLSRDDNTLQQFCNASVPAYFVWRTDVSRSDIYHSTSPDGTTWNWTTYKAQSQSEQGAWVQIFMGDRANFSLPNLRAGVAAIFTGSAQQNAQRDHCLSVGRRLATFVEKLFATGTGTALSPATMVFEGQLSALDVSMALNRNP